MKYLDEYRDGAAAREAGGGDRADGHAAVDDHGGLRRPDAHASSSTGSTRSCRRRRAGARAGLPGLRDPARDDRPRPRDRLAARTSSSARSATCSACPARAATCLQLKSQGSDVRIVYSPLDAVNLAAANPDRQVVFFAIGFETTAPANAMAVWHGAEAAADELQRAGLARARAAGDDGPPRSARQPRAGIPRARATSAPSWATSEYEPIARAYRRADRDHRLRAARPARGRAAGRCGSSRTGRAEVENPYARAVRPEGNPASRRLIDDVFEVCDRKWRGIGLIPRSGYRLRDEYRDHDAERLFDVGDIETQESPVCISGQILQGLKKPHDCPAFGRECTPQTPLGATMVSSEGACAAYYAYGRHLEPAAHGS